MAIALGGRYKKWNLSFAGSRGSYKGENWSYSASLGFRQLFMDMHMENDMGWAKEKDIYSGPYISTRAKFSSLEKLTHVKRKDRKKQINN